MSYVNVIFDQSDAARDFSDILSRWDSPDRMVLEVADHYSQYDQGDDTDATSDWTGSTVDAVPHHRGEDYAALPDGRTLVWHAGLGYVSLYRHATA